MCRSTVTFATKVSLVKTPQSHPVSTCQKPHISALSNCRLPYPSATLPLAYQMLRVSHFDTSFYKAANSNSKPTLEPVHMAEALQHHTAAASLGCFRQVQTFGINTSLVPKSEFWKCLTQGPRVWNCVLCASPPKVTVPQKTVRWTRIQKVPHCLPAVCWENKGEARKRLNPQWKISSSLAFTGAVLPGCRLTTIFSTDIWGPSKSKTELHYRGVEQLNLKEGKPN